MQKDPEHTPESNKPQSGSTRAGEPRPMVVGIGGSAGGLQAAMTVLEALGSDAPVAIVLVLHLDPDHESSAAEILQRITPLTVSQVRERTLLQAGHVYVIAPGINLITEDGHVQPGGGRPRRPSSVIDLFFRSLGEVHGEHAVGIVLSGTGRDGSLGLANIKEHGGLAISQSPEDAEYGDMPNAAIASGSVDLILAASEIGRRLIELAKSTRPLLREIGSNGTLGPDEASAAGDEKYDGKALHDILAALRTRTRHDFRHYKRATMLRRIERRVQVNRLDSMTAYRDFVRNNPAELTPLLADMLISVTSFFRDPTAFNALQEEVIPRLMDSIEPGEDARVWIPACASGEESYSVAILIQEYADRMQHPPAVQIFASDINAAALDHARAGVYPANVEADITDSRLLGYFDKEEDACYRVRSGIREMIVFAQHNVLNDPPFSRLDLVCCRNLMIYLDRTAQSAVLEMFAYALKPGGYLFLGNAESIDLASTAFDTVSKEHRIYRLRHDGASSARARMPSQMLAVGAPPPTPRSPAQNALFTPRANVLEALHEQALAAAAPPSVLINADYDIERVSSGASRFITLGEGVPTRNLLNNVSPDIRIELRAALYRAGESKQGVRTVFRRSAQNGRGNGPVMTMSVNPARGADGESTFWLVVFDEPLESHIGLSDLTSIESTIHEATMQRLEEENTSLKAHLQDTLDRSAVSNEELKASNEELQAINEELRSAKEELETSKEELQSANEELTTVNFELRMKVDEAGRHNDDLRNLMEASDIATVFVDPGMRVKRFTPKASKLFALIPSDIGRPLMDVKSRLHYEEIVIDATSAFKQLLPIERGVTSVDNEHFLARIQPYRTSQDKIGGAVLTFIDVTELRHAENRVRRSEERLRDAIASSKDFAVLSTDRDGIITTWNEGAAAMFGYAPNEVLGKSIDILFTAEDRANDVPKQERSSAAREGRASDERWHVRKDGTPFFCSGVVTPINTELGLGYVKIARDISEVKRRESLQDATLTEERRSKAVIEAGLELKDRFLAEMAHELRQPLNLIQVNAELLVRLPETRGSAAVQRIGSTIVKAVSAQETIVNDLLDHSRIQTGKLKLHREPTDLAEIVGRFAQAMTSDLARKRIPLQVHSDEPVIVDGDPVRIEQVVWNLLGNAIKFTPEGGSIRISVFADQRVAKLQVSDTGSGISPDFLPRIFDLFSQGEAAKSIGPRRAGLGIGLALVRDLVVAHGGRIDAASPGIGQGSTFTVQLPLAATGHLRTGGTHPLVPLDLRILLIDDDMESLSAFAELLKIEGAVVEVTTSPTEALTLLSAEKFDVLLSDLGMPEMSGLDLIKRARIIKPANAFRAFAITGDSGEDCVREVIAAGFDGHIAKPVSIDRLRIALTRA